MLNKALQLARDNPNARVLYVADSRPQLMNIKASVCTNDWIWESHSSRMRMPNGSVIQFLVVSDVEDYCHGAQFSHVVIDTETHTYALWSLLRSRVRSHIKHKGMGVYDRIGAYVYYVEEG